MSKQLKWDKRFLGLAKVYASWSKDPSTKTGAIITRPNNTIVGFGFNGFPRGMEDSEHRYRDRIEKYDRIIHCEMNALLNANGPIKGCTLYTWPLASCGRCAVHMIQAGIVRVVYPAMPGYMADRWEASVGNAIKYFQEAGVETCKVST